MGISRVTRKKIQASYIDLSILSREIFEQLRTDQPERNIQFETQDNINIWGDPGLMRIAMENLIGNAWKYTSKISNAKISLSSSSNGDITTFELQDNGVGFNMDHVDRIFEVFQRLHGKNDFDGTGVGLATVKRVIERHQGSVWASGEKGKGASFFFTLNSPQHTE